MRALVFALLSLAACGSTAPLAGAPCPCSDGYVCCPSKVCVAEDDICPADFADPLVHLIAPAFSPYLGAGVCGGQREDSEGDLETWTVVPGPGQREAAIDSDQDGEADRWVVARFSSPLHLDQLSETDEDSGTSTSVWLYNTGGDVRSFSFATDDGSVSASATWSYFANRYEIRHGEQVDTYFQDAMGRVTHIERSSGWMGEITYGEHGPVHLHSEDSAWDVRYAYDDRGQLERVEERSEGAEGGLEIERDALGRVESVRRSGWDGWSHWARFTYDYCD